MGRPSGSRSSDFESKREALAASVLKHLLRTGAPETSMRSLAAASGVTPPTLRHYFGDRIGAIAAAFEIAHQAGAEHLERTRSMDRGNAEATLAAALGYLVQGWREHGVGALHAIALAAGLTTDSLGVTYLQELLEPTLVAFESLLGRLDADGELAVPDPRVAALQLIAPLFLALLHQQELGGRSCRPLDLTSFLDAHVQGFLRQYGEAN